MSIGLTLLIAFLMLALSFFFSGVEIAFLSTKLLRIELKMKQGDKSAQILSRFKKKEMRAKVLITILIGNNIALVVFTQMIERLFQAPLENYGITPGSTYLLYTFLLTIIGTLIVLVFAEYIPKAIFKSLANRIIFPSTYILNFFYRILEIPVWLIDHISKFVLRYMFRIKTLEESSELGRQDLDFYVREVINSETGKASMVPELDQKMFHNALDFRETKAREFMIPRTEIEAAPLDISVNELRDQFIETQLSKIIIYGENLDDIKGFVHCNSMFEMPKSVKTVLQEPLMIPETMAADILLVEFNENKKTVAIVVDEFGGTAGLITMEDLVEEVFGEIEDEYDKIETEEDMIIRKNSDSSYTLGARQEIDDLNEKLGIQLPEEESYTTLGGLFIYNAENIPKTGKEIMVGPYRLKATKVADNRIIQIHLQELLSTQ